ncbi:MAG TPA: hypothetical protein VJ992_12295 [Gemmatimonadales bacterium]|nr:hypothetical protein [Gemmatimonadales bacterium]
MSTSKRISVKLTEEQRRQIREATGKDAVEFTMETNELEERVAPMAISLKFA